MIDPLLVMISIKNHTKLIVSIIFLIDDRLSIVRLVLLPKRDCGITSFGGPLMPLGNYSGYIYCTTSDVGIKQICPSGTKVIFRMGGCVNITSEYKTKY